MDKKQIKLNVGCGIYLVSGFINIDKVYKYEEITSKAGYFINALVEPGAEYLQADVLKLPFQDNHADYVESIDMIEHLPFRQVLGAVKEMRRVLKNGHTLKVVTANFDEVAKEWTEKVADKMIDFGDPKSPFYDLTEIIYGNQASEGEFHCVPINPAYAYALFRNAGFEEEKIEIRIYPKGVHCDLPDLQTSGPKELKKNLVLRNGMLVISAIK